MKGEWADKQVTKEKAIRLAKSKFWEELSDEAIVGFQLFQRRLCMPFSVFHKAIEKAFNRPVWTHEFAFHKGLVKEYLGEKTPPTMQEIIDLIPKEKRVIIAI